MMIKVLTGLRAEVAGDIWGHHAVGVRKVDGKKWRLWMEEHSGM